MSSSFAVDHVFVMCSVGAPEAAALVRAGLTEDSANTHPGQGTANRRFFFDNALTGLRIGLPGSTGRSEAARAAAKTGLVTFVAADGYVMTLRFDGEARRRSTDLRPELPLVLSW